MLGRYRWSAVGSVFLALVLLACPEPEEELLSRQRAIDLALQEIEPTADHPLVARMPLEPLEPGDRVGGPFDDELRESSQREWLVWIDDEPGAFQSHDGRLLFVSRTTGAIETIPADDVPFKNDQPIWDDLEAFADRTSWIYDNLEQIALPDGGVTFLEGGEEDAAEEPPGERPPREPVPPRAPEDCCEEPLHRIGLLLYNFDNGPLRRDIEDNVTGMAAALRANGYSVPDFPSSTGSGNPQPAIYLGDRRGRGLQQLRDFVAQHQGEEHCCDEIVVYYTGHGKRKRIRGRERFYFGLRTSYRGEAGDRRREKRLYAEDLAAILDGLSSCHVNVVIDACYSGGFIEALAANRGVETVRTSAGSREKAWGGAYDAAGRGRIPDPYGRADGEKGSEFTSGFVKGLNEAAASRPAGAPPPTGHDLADAGFLEAVENDIAAIAGKTRPTGVTRLEGECDCCGEDGGGED